MNGAVRLPHLMQPFAKWKSREIRLPRAAATYIKWLYTFQKLTLFISNITIGSLSARKDILLIYSATLHLSWASEGSEGSSWSKCIKIELAPVIGRLWVLVDFSSEDQRSSKIEVRGLIVRVKACAYKHNTCFSYCLGTKLVLHNSAEIVSLPASFLHNEVSSCFLQVRLGISWINLSEALPLGSTKHII